MFWCTGERVHRSPGACEDAWVFLGRASLSRAPAEGAPAGQVGDQRRCQVASERAEHLQGGDSFIIIYHCCFYLLLLDIMFTHVRC